VPGGQARTATGAPSSWKAVGIPAAWGSWHIAPTGNNNQVRIDQYTVPPSHGGVTTLKVYRGSQLIDTPSNPNGPLTESTPDNDQAYDFHLEVCNENDQCSKSSTQSVTSYGPLADSDILSITRTGSGTNVGWNVTVDSNGKSGVSVRLTSNRGSLASWTTSNVDVQTFAFAPRDIGYSATETPTVTISQNGRGTGTKNGPTATTPAPPPPTVAVSRGTACNDGGSSPCPKPGTQCLDPSCGYIVLDVEGWNSGSSVTCVLSSANHGGISTKTVTANGKTQTSAYFGYQGDTVTASCSGRGPGGNSATGSTTWP
jgi:hypothetical protein